MRNHSDTTCSYANEQQAEPNDRAGFIRAKKYLAQDVYTRNMTDWPSTCNALFFNEPEAIYSRFIKLFYNLNKQGINWCDPVNQNEKQKLQRIFAYLLNIITDDSEKKAEKKRMFFCFNFLALCPALINTTEDASFILSHVTQNKRSWLKACITQALRNRKETLVLQQKKSATHDAILDATYVGSELANIGIVIQEVVGGVLLNQQWIEIGIQVSRYSNPLIYAFKVMQRLLKLIGRNYFGLEFAEDEIGINPNQNFWDGISAVLFLVVSVLLAINIPVLTGVAWLIAPVGLLVVWKSEYGYQNQCAIQRQQNMKESEGLFDEQSQAEADRVAVHKKFSSWALFGVIVFICLGMLAAHAAGIPGLNWIFNEYTLRAITMVTGIALASLAVFRAVNFFWERKNLGILVSIREFFTNPIFNIMTFCKKAANSLVSGAISIPEKIEFYRNNTGPWQKTAVFSTLIFSVISIAALSEGLSVIASLALAGVCSLTAPVIQYAPSLYSTIKNKAQEKSQSHTEPYKNDSECVYVINELAAHFSIATGVPRQKQKSDTVPLSFEKVCIKMEAKNKNFEQLDDKTDLTPRITY